MSAIGLDIEKLSFAYDPNRVLFSELSLKVNAGEKIGIVGPSGCGKSTLLKLILGLLKPHGGKIEWSIAPEGRLGVVFQEPVLLPWKNVEENIALPLELLKKHYSENLIQATLESVGLKNWGNAYPSQLSGGMKMRVALARALVTHPGVLLMDEPFSSLDEILREKLDLDLYRLLEQEKMTFFLVTHNISEAVFLCDRLWVLGKAGEGLKADIQVSLRDKKRDQDFFLDHGVVDQVKKIRSYLREELNVWGGRESP